MDRLATVSSSGARQVAGTGPIGQRGWILFGLMGAIWGVPYLFIKVAVEHLSPPVVVFGRTAIAAVPLLFFAARADAIRPALASWKPLLAFAALEMAVPWLLLTDAEQHLPSGLTGLLIACVPIVGAVVAFLLGDRSALRPTRLAGIAVGIAGVTFWSPQTSAARRRGGASLKFSWCASATPRRRSSPPAASATSPTSVSSPCR